MAASSLKSFTNLLRCCCGSLENWDSLNGRLSKGILNWGGEIVLADREGVWKRVLAAVDLTAGVVVHVGQAATVGGCCWLSCCCCS